MTVRLVGAREIRTMLAPIARRRFYKLAKRRGFPAAAATLAQGRLWRAEEVESWIALNRRPSPSPTSPR
ncbi:DNA-binding protein [Actinoplanes sp. NPDC051470]|uniref:DNA-binding protein n=1 Tax=unclassified Actinoplanes TaxID=2626549 RepID=UPI003431BFF4